MSSIDWGRKVTAGVSRLSSKAKTRTREENIKSVAKKTKKSKLTLNKFFRKPDMKGVDDAAKSYVGSYLGTYSTYSKR